MSNYQSASEVFATLEDGKVMYSGNAGEMWMETDLTKVDGLSEYDLGIVRAKFRKSLEHQPSDPKTNNVLMTLYRLWKSINH